MGIECITAIKQLCSQLGTSRIFYQVLVSELILSTESKELCHYLTGCLAVPSVYFAEFIFF